MSKMPSQDLLFAPSQPLTLGVEIEVQLLDPDSLDLNPKSPQLLASLTHLGDRVKAEIFQSMLELNTGVCNTAHEVRQDLGESIEETSKIASTHGLRLASSGTHPFALYNQRILYPAERYQQLIDRNQWIARRLMIFGMHVHVGMRDGEHAIQMSNAALHYLPMLLALSASSPYWHGEDTELASSRITFFEALPTGGHPCQVATWEEFTDLYAKLLKCEAIRSPKDLWWDIRPSPSYGTIEFRICDGLSNLEETVAITAFIHAMCVYIDRQLATGRRFLPPPDWILRENKWRASRWGVESKLIVNDKGDTAPLRELVSHLLSELAPICSEMKYESEFETIRKVMELGNSSERQRKIARATNGDMKAVTEFNAREFELRRPIWDVSEP